MAKFNASGIKGLQLSFEEFSKLPDEVVEDILDAGAKVVVKAHKASIRALGLVDTGKLEQSIKAHKKAEPGGNRYVLVYPTGQHHKRNRHEVTKTYARSKHGRTYTVGGDVKDVPANEVGFIQEFGAPRRNIKATQWMQKANDKCAAEVEKAEAEAYDDWLKRNNL